MKLLIYSASDICHFKIKAALKTQQVDIIATKNFSAMHNFLYRHLFNIIMIDKKHISIYFDFFKHIQIHNLHGYIILFNEKETKTAPELLSYWNDCNSMKDTESLQPLLKQLAAALAFSKKKKTILSKKENILFEFLTKNKNTEIAIGKLAHEVYGDNSKKSINTIYHTIHNLRKSLGDDLKKPHLLIRTTKGFYKLLDIL